MLIACHRGVTAVGTPRAHQIISSACVTSQPFSASAPGQPAVSRWRLKYLPTGRIQAVARAAACGNRCRLTLESDQLRTLCSMQGVAVLQAPKHQRHQEFLFIDKDLR